jgi:glucosamine--fructose-6-phosphate aminotransferase (isomerizing)
MSLQENTMKLQVESLPQLLPEVFDAIEHSVRTAIPTPEIFAARKIIVTGCGDSLIAARAALQHFREYTGLDVEVLPALEVSRYWSAKRIGACPDNPLLIGVSNSGNVARVYEAVKYFDLKGGNTLAVTSKSDSRLAAASRRQVIFENPPFEPAPGVRSYFLILLSLFLLSIRFGEVLGRYTMDTANKYRKEIIDAGPVLDQAVSASAETCRSWAHTAQSASYIQFIGAGPDEASAHYGRAKTIEASGRQASAVNLEEWVHIDFFIRDIEKTPLFFISTSDSPGLSRLEEVLAICRDQERECFVVHQGETLSTQSTYIKVISLPHFISYQWAPIVHCIPPALFASFLTEELGESYGRGAADRWSMCQNGGTTVNSSVIVDGKME